MKPLVKSTLFLAVFMASLLVYSSSCNLLSSEDHDAIKSLDTNIDLFKLEISRLNDNLEAIKNSSMPTDLSLMIQCMEQLQVEIYQLRTTKEIQECLAELNKLNSRLENLDNLADSTAELTTFLKENEAVLRSLAESMEELRNPYGYSESGD